MTMKTTRAFDVFSGDYSERVKELYTAKEAAILAVKNETDMIMGEVVRYLRAHPGEAVTVNDIADTSGLKRSTIRSWFDKKGWRDITSTKILVERRYAEVDERGRLVPNGKTTVTKWHATAYCCR